MGARDRMAKLLTPDRLLRFGAAVGIGAVIGFIVFVVTADGVSTLGGGRLGGDWVAFRAAGVLARTDPMSLLDPVAQQAQMQPYLADQFTPFPYPPVFAFVFVPLSLLPYDLGYVLYALLLVLAGIVAVHWTMDVLGVSRRWQGVGMVGALTFAPFLVAVGGAQNATLTLLVLAATFRLLQREQDVAAGLALSALWFKPQFAIPVIGLILLAGRVRTAITALLGGAGLWLVTTALFGTDWVTRWADTILSLTLDGNRRFNTGATVSVVQWLAGTFPTDRGLVTSLVVAVALGIGFCLLARTHRDPAYLLPLTCIALLVTAPHALRYELVLLIPLLAALARTRAIVFTTVAWLLGGVMVLPIHPAVRILYVWSLAVAWWLDTRRTPDDLTDPGLVGVSGTPDRGSRIVRMIQRGALTGGES